MAGERSSGRNRNKASGGGSGGSRSRSRNQGDKGSSKGSNKGSNKGAGQPAQRSGDHAVSVTFLGGLGEIGRNCAAVEQDGQILLIDCGLMFPDNDMLGIDLVLPDFSWLLERADDIVGLVATHGHEDHVGGLSYLLRDASFPIYGTGLTLGLARGRIEEAGLLGRTELNVVADGERVRVGPFELEFLPVTHSVPEGVATVIRTAQGVVMHSGDIKIDLTPVDGRLTDLTRMGAIAHDEGVRLLLADSTNAEERGHSRSESSIGSVLYDLMHEHEGRRVITACFASHIHRIQQIADAAVAFGRKVAPLGRSMLRNVAMAREMGLLNIADSSLIDIADVDDFEPGEVCVICTGSQGEPMSALTRLSQSENRFLKLTPHDTIILSSHPIPGNEHDVSRVIGNLIRQGAEVVHSGLHDVHATGHAKAEELKLLQSVIQPEWFVPVHGEYRHMVAHANLAVTMGRPRDHVLVAEDGDRLVLDGEGLRFDGRVPSEYVYVHGTVGDVGHGVLADRRILADEGMVTVIAVVDRKRGRIVAGPEVATRGWIVTEDSADLVAELASDVESALGDALESDAELQQLTKAVRRAAGSFVSKRTRRRPMIVPVVLES